MKLMEPFGAAIADLTLRPLLFTGVTAASAGIFCYLFKRGDGKKPTADPQDKTPPEAVCDQATELSLLQPKEVPQYQISMAEAEKKHQNAVESITQMESEKSALQDQIETLQKTVLEMGNLLKESNTNCNNLKNERERELESHNLLKIKCKEMEESVAHKEELLKVSLAEAEEKHQNAVEIITQLEVEKSALQGKIETLENTVQKMSIQLIDSCMECDDLTNECEQERESHSLLQDEYEEMKKTLINKEKLLKVSLAEAEEKHQNAVESITQLEVEKSALQDKIETLENTALYLKVQLTDSCMECYDLTNECEQERESHSLLQDEYEEMKKTLINKEELLKVSLAEAEEKHQNAVESITQLEVEKSALQDKIETLENTVQEMSIQLIDSCMECDDLTNECEQERESHSLLQDEYEEMKKTLINKEELLKVSLAEAEEKHQNAVESITQLEVDKSALQDKIETLKNTVHEIRNQLIDSCMECDKLKNERDQEQESYSLLQVSLTNVKEKQQKAAETIAQLKEERTDLTIREPAQ
ncbi:hypothetical protein HF521_022446 [Silurus meridionalis]|uniref:Minor extracellular protease Epr GA-like domain-containing protein n=1 Tax=Silurus meridionalis TaxID=175797 RepID=A0A8T0B9Z4_SILME|nr:hypothetical protein HF521_022446 [Silurus meridionalis]